MYVFKIQDLLFLKYLLKSLNRLFFKANYCTLKSLLLGSLERLLYIFLKEGSQPNIGMLRYIGWYRQRLRYGPILLVSVSEYTTSVSHRYYAGVRNRRTPVRNRTQAHLSPDPEQISGGKKKGARGAIADRS